MERTLTRRLPTSSQLGAHVALIAPAEHGWRIRFGGEKENAARVVESLGGAANAVPAGKAIHLALPVGAVVIERMQLPSTSREELEGMVRLQLEKTLPFSGDEVATDFQIIEQSETESTLLAFTVSAAQLDTLCEPLRAQRKLPEKITLFALHVAAGCCPPGETACVIFREQETIVLAVAQDAKLAYAQTLSTTDADEFFAELPQALLSAELDGVPVSFARVLLDDAFFAWSDRAREFFSTVPVELISLHDMPMPEPAINLVPAVWLQEQKKLERSTRLRSQLVLLGVLYLALLLCAAGYVIWLQRQTAQVAQLVAGSASEVTKIGEQKSRWSALAPAIDPTHYTVEVLYQISSSIPSDDLRITSFEQTPSQFTISGEAPTAALAIDFGDRLKNNPELKQFKFTIPPPATLPNEHAQFRIFGKL